MTALPSLALHVFHYHYLHLPGNITAHSPRLRLKTMINTCSPLFIFQLKPEVISES